MVLKPEISTCPATLGDLPCVFDEGHAYGHYFQATGGPEGGDQ